MIYTLTLNPALDYIISIPQLVRGDINRSEGELMLPGGKGINVSHVLHNMGCDTRILGFSAGATGELLKSLLSKAGLSQELLTASGGSTRLNVQLRSSGAKEETEITGIGPMISSDDLTALSAQLDRLLAPGDTLVMSGSLPKLVPDSIYADIMKQFSGKGIRLVVDSTQDRLLQVLPLGPFVIKPNNHELGEIFGVSLKTREDVLPYAIRLREMGAQNVLVSLAGEGAVLAAENGQVYCSPAPKGVLRNSLGAGDSMVAGFLYGYEKTHDLQEALLYGLSCGSASAFSDGFAQPELVEELHAQLTKQLQTAS